MEFVDSKTIKLDKIINDLDRFAFRFIKVLEQHCEYVVVSGYVAILFGRTRSSEDVDVFVKELSKDEFLLLYDDLRKHGFWCLNGETASGLYGYLAEGSALRFSDDGEIFPNVELKFARKRLDLEAFSDVMAVITPLGRINISSIERQVAFKRYFLKSDKDLEDALHLEKVFKEKLNFGKVGLYRQLIENEMAKTRKG